jgi:hypothetical protein
MLEAGRLACFLLTPIWLSEQALDLDLGAYDGIALTVLGDGQTFKLNLKTADQEDVPESTYQATFDTVAGACACCLL